MTPFRAVWTHVERLDVEGTWATDNIRTVETPVVVVAGYAPDDAASYRYVAHRQDNGAGVDDYHGNFRATEPTYLAEAGKDEPDHEHDFSGVGQPMQDGNRIVAIRRRCTHPGCFEVFDTPTGGTKGLLG